MVLPLGSAVAGATVLQKGVCKVTRHAPHLGLRQTAAV